MKRFCTTYTGDDGFQYADTVDAVDTEHAQELCDQRRPGERVEGVLWLQFKDTDMTQERIDEITRDMASTYGDSEPPDASEFDR